MNVRLPAAFLSIAAIAPSGAHAGPTSAALARDTLAAICPAATAAEEIASRIPGSVVVRETSEGPDGSPGRWEAMLALDGGATVRAVRFAPAGMLRRVTVDIAEPIVGATRARLHLSANNTCEIIDARRLSYDATGAVDRLDILSPDLSTVIETEALNPPIPADTNVDAGAVRIALIDSGVNYTLDWVAARLARAGDGRALGYDYWDLDDQPYDANPTASPFYPLHHGTTVASILLREAPDAALIPYRYPRPNMARMGDLVAQAAVDGAHIVVLPMGSGDPDEWHAFIEAATAHSDLLFLISAGDDGRDLNADPVYPAAAAPPNALVVTSATAFGKLAPLANWGTGVVDVMVPAERIAVIDHRGAPGTAAGSSYAVPRVAALAARLLVDNPDWRAAALKAAIVDRARPSPYERADVTTYGWIANPDQDP